MLVMRSNDPGTPDKVGVNATDLLDDWNQRNFSNEDPVDFRELILFMFVPESVPVDASSPDEEILAAVVAAMGPNVTLLEESREELLARKALAGATAP